MGGELGRPFRSSSVAGLIPGVCPFDCVASVCDRRGQADFSREQHRVPATRRHCANALNSFLHARSCHDSGVSMTESKQPTIGDALIIAKHIGTQMTLATQSSREALTRWRSLQQEIYGSKEEERAAEKALVLAVANDLGNIGWICACVQTLDAILVEGGTTTRIADRLAGHSAGSRRKVGKYNSLPAQSSLALMTEQLARWVYHTGHEIQTQFRAVPEFELPCQDEPISSLSPRFWHELSEQVKTYVDAFSMSSELLRAVAIAGYIPESLPEDFADDAVEELVSYANTLDDENALQGSGAVRVGGYVVSSQQQSDNKSVLDSSAPDRVLPDVSASALESNASCRDDSRTLTFEEILAIRTDFQATLPFLVWTDSGGAMFGQTPKGELGYKRNDGLAAVPRNDPSVAAYTKFEERVRLQGFWLSVGGAPTKIVTQERRNPSCQVSHSLNSLLVETAEQIRTLMEYASSIESWDFWDVVTDTRPELMRRLIDNNSDYRMTVSEKAFLEPTYLKRLRRLREMPMSQRPSSSGKELTEIRAALQVILESPLSGIADLADAVRKLALAVTGPEKRAEAERACELVTIKDIVERLRLAGHRFDESTLRKWANSSTGTKRKFPEAKIPTRPKKWELEAVKAWLSSEQGIIL